MIFSLIIYHYYFYKIVTPGCLQSSLVLNYIQLKYSLAHYSNEIELCTLRPVVGHFITICTYLLVSSIHCRTQNESSVGRNTMQTQNNGIKWNFVKRKYLIFILLFKNWQNLYWHNYLEHKYNALHCISTITITYYGHYSWFFKVP